MSAKTGVEWTDATWNPIRGCTRVSEGCRNCYAERVAARFSTKWKDVPSGVESEGFYHGPFSNVITGGRWNGQIEFVESLLQEPISWRRPRRIFVNSMSDLFHESVSDDQIDWIFAVMSLAPRHTYQVLTKRPERMLAYIKADRRGFIEGRAKRIGRSRSVNMDGLFLKVWPFPHLWMGVSVENQRAVDERVPLLLQTPAAVRFLSCEPLLGPVDLKPAPIGKWPDGSCWMPNRGEPDDWKYWMHRDGGIKWVIAGGESGPSARPMHPEWVRSLRDQCLAAGVPFFFKQWGEWAPDCLCGRLKPCRSIPRPEPGRLGAMFRCGKVPAGRILDGRTWDEFPR